MANSPDVLINKTAAHQINLVRYANSQAAGAIPFFEQLIDYINARLMREGESIASKKRLKAVLDDIESKMDQLLGAYSSQIQDLVPTVAQQEIEFNEQMIAAVVDDYAVVIPPLEKAITAIYNNPLLIGSGGGAVSFAELTEGWTAPEIKRVAQRISSGFYLGETPTQIARAISGTKRNGYKDGLLEISRRAAQTMAKTAVMDMATQAKTAFNLANDDLIIGEEVVATLDSGTSDYCRGVDGKVYLYADGPFPRPPYHSNCFPGDTDIATCSAVSNVYKRAYKGAFVKIVTASGKSILATPNHPILTARGWVAIKLIDRGDKVAAIDRHEALSSHYNESVVAKFAELFSALDVSCDPLLVTERPSSAKDFHGDGSDQKIDVVLPDRGTWDRVKAMLFDGVKNNNLPLGAEAATSCCGTFGSPRIYNARRECGYRLGALNKLFLFGLSALGRLVSGSRKLRDLLGSASCHSHKLLLRSVPCGHSCPPNDSRYDVMTDLKAEMASDTANADARKETINDRPLDLSAEAMVSLASNLDAAGGEDSRHDLSGDSNGVCDRLGGLAGLVTLDEVVDVSFTEEILCHVYNLENKDNWYLANGIIAHNCRTTLSPVLSPEFDFTRAGRTRPAVGEGGAQRVDAGTSYYEWLKAQPKSVQDDALGPKKADIFRNAGLTADEFRKAATVGLNQPLTIELLRKRNKEIAQYLDNQ